MIRVIVCMIGFFVFGVIYAEILNELKIFDFRVNVYLIAGSMAMIFLASEWVLKHYKRKARLSDWDKIRFGKIQNYYYMCLVVIGFILLVALPFIWWGTILRLANTANGGIR